MITLKDFNDQIIRPKVLRDIRSGRLDNVILDPDVIETIKDDDEIIEAIASRLCAIALDRP